MGRNANRSDPRITSRRSHGRWSFSTPNIFAVLSLPRSNQYQRRHEESRRSRPFCQKKHGEMSSLSRLRRRGSCTGRTTMPTCQTRIRTCSPGSKRDRTSPAGVLFSVSETLQLDHDTYGSSSSAAENPKVFSFSGSDHSRWNYSTGRRSILTLMALSGREISNF